MIQQIRRFSNYFLIGILAIIPIFVIIQIIVFVAELFRNFFQFVYGYTANNLLMTSLAFFTAIGLVVFIGYRIKYGTSYIIQAFEVVVDRIPVLNSIYRITKKILQQFNREQEKDTKEVVYIEYPKNDVWVPGYVTNRDGEMYVIYVPTSPNPTSGFTVIVHESKVVHSEMDIEQMTSFVVSVGVDFDKEKEMHVLKPSNL